MMPASSPSIRQQPPLASSRFRKPASIRTAARAREDVWAARHGVRAERGCVNTNLGSREPPQGIAGYAPEAPGSVHSRVRAGRGCVNPNVELHEPNQRVEVLPPDAPMNARWAVPTALSSAVRKIMNFVAENRSLTAGVGLVTLGIGATLGLPIAACFLGAALCLIGVSAETVAEARKVAQVVANATVQAAKEAAVQTAAFAGAVLSLVKGICVGLGLVLASVALLVLACVANSALTK